MWSGNRQLSFRGSAPGQYVDLSFPVSVAGEYNLALNITKATDYGKVKYTLDGAPIGPDEVDGYSPRVQSAHQPLGIRYLTAGTHTLRLTTTGSRATVAPYYVAGIDYLIVTQSTRLEAEQDNQFPVTQPTGQNVPVTAQAYDPRERGPGPFSDNYQRLLAATEEGQSFDFRFRTPVEADYALGIALSKWVTYGRIRIEVDGTPLLRTDKTPWDGYATSGGTTYQPLGGAHLAAGTHTLTLTVVGKNPSSTGFRIGVDYFSAVALNNVTTENFTAAMNNNGIGADGVGADLDLTNGSLSAQTLAGAGYAPGSAVTVNGATFTMPAPRADGMDNVVAIGQTIPLPVHQQVKATAVGLLLTGTCGGAPENTGALTFTDGTTMDTDFPEVPDWIYNSNGRRVLQLPHRNEGPTAVPSKMPAFFAVFVPSDPRKELRSITLPNYGSSLLPHDCTPKVHVLAIAPRPVATGWLGSWAAYGKYATEPYVDLGNKTLRTVITPSVTGPSARVRISNARSAAPVTIGAASIAAQSGTDAAAVGAPTPLKFNGSTQVTIPAGAEVYTDPVTFPSTTGGSGKLLISMYLPNSPEVAPSHSTSHLPSHVAVGNATGDTTGTPFTDSMFEYWFVAGLEVSTSDPTLGAVAVLGDNTAATAVPDDGPTWVDQLPGKLAAAGTPLPGSLVNLSATSWNEASEFVDNLDRTVLNQPNLRTVIVALGEEDISWGGDFQQTKDALTELIHSTGPGGIRNFRRADGSPVHVILMTVPPMDLPANDEQELARRQLNLDIRNNFTDYGAHEIVDIAAVLEDPANPGYTRPEYWDDATGWPNAAYYDRIAQHVADEASRFPPGAQL